MLGRQIFKQNDRSAFSESIFTDLSRKMVFEQEQKYIEELRDINIQGEHFRQRVEIVQQAGLAGSTVKDVRNSKEALLAGKLRQGPEWQEMRSERGSEAGFCRTFWGFLRTDSAYIHQHECKNSLRTLGLAKGLRSAERTLTHPPAPFAIGCTEAQRDDLFPKVKLPFHTIHRST